MVDQVLPLGEPAYHAQKSRSRHRRWRWREVGVAHDDIGSGPLAPRSRLVCPVRETAAPLRSAACLWPVELRPTVGHAVEVRLARLRWPVSTMAAPWRRRLRRVRHRAERAVSVSKRSVIGGRDTTRRRGVPAGPDMAQAAASTSDVAAEPQPQFRQALDAGRRALDDGRIHEQQELAVLASRLTRPPGPAGRRSGRHERRRRRGPRWSAPARRGSRRSSRVERVPGVVAARPSSASVRRGPA